MNHYEVLGVGRGASRAEIRRAYLLLARRHHPDFHHADRNGAQNARPDGGDLTIRRLNAAWEVLGDAARRADYDQMLDSPGGVPDGVEFRGARRGAPSVSRIHRPSTEFRPRHNGPDPSDEWRYRPDALDPATAPARWLLAAPVLSFVFGVGFLIISIPTAIRAFTALGLICLFVAALLFVGAPVVAMFKSRNAELRVQRQRARPGR